MKAVVLKEIGVIEVQDVPEPEPEPDQIKVKIAYAGICGSDPKIIAGLNKPAYREGAIGGPLKNDAGASRGQDHGARSLRHNC